MALTLKSITFKSAPRIPGIRPGDCTEMNCENPPESLKDWHVVIKGATVMLISPPGWRSGSYTRESGGKGPRRFHEIPRNNCFLYFEGELEEIKAIQDPSKVFTSDPFGVPTQAKASTSASENDR